MSTNLTLPILARDLADGRTTSRALVEECLARIADTSGEGARAFVSVDADGARRAADAQDLLRKAGAAPSPLAGPVRAQRTGGDAARRNRRRTCLVDAACGHAGS